MVAVDEYTGSFQKNPFNFQNFGTNEQFISINGTTIPTSPYRPDFTKKYGFTRMFRGLYDNIGISLEDAATQVTMEQFQNGSNIMAYDLSPHSCSNVCMHKGTNGSMNVFVGLAQANTEPIELMVFATFNRVVRFDKTGKIFVTTPELSEKS